MQTSRESQPTVIVGAGLAGLSCANYLARAGLPYLLLEANDRVGGRVRTDQIDGFRLDRGFQVFQSAYPEAKQLLDYDRLQLQTLEPGALIRQRGRWVRMSDPLRRPRRTLTTLCNRIGTPLDRWRIWRLRQEVQQRSIEELLTQPEDCPTSEVLERHYGFSRQFIRAFLKPWLSGIFLEDQLATSGNYFKFIFKIMAEGEVCYPLQGIQAIPDQLAGNLDPASIRCKSPISQVDLQSVTLNTGEVLAAQDVVLAVDASRLHQVAGLSSRPPQHQITKSPEFAATRCLYFSADQRTVATPILHEPTLFLNGDGVGPINHVIILTNASSQTAPPDKSLVSVTLVGDHARQRIREAAIVEQLTKWFGEQVRHWKLIRQYAIHDALPLQPPGFYERPGYSVQDTSGIIVCGDYLETTSVNGALKSGRVAAERVLDRRRRVT